MPKLWDKLRNASKIAPLSFVAPASLPVVQPVASPDPGYSAAKGRREVVGPAPAPAPPRPTPAPPRPATASASSYVTTPAPRGRSEAIQIEHTCVNRGKPFFVGMVKKAGDSCFRVVGYQPHPLDPEQAKVAFGISVTVVDAAIIPVSEINYSGLICPHCAAPNITVVRCLKCQRDTCSGRIIECDDGTLLHTCADDCRSHGAVRGHYNSVTSRRVDVSAAKSGPALDDRRPTFARVNSPPPRDRLPRGRA